MFARIFDYLAPPQIFLLGILAAYLGLLAWGIVLLLLLMIRKRYLRIKFKNDVTGFIKTKSNKNAKNSHLSFGEEKEIHYGRKT